MSVNTHSLIRRRIVFLFIVVFILIILLAGRLTWIQVIKKEEYEDKALTQRLRSLKVQPKRGIIYDRNMIELALSASADTVVAFPAEIKDPAATARELAGILSLDEETIYEKITKRAAAVYLERKVSPEKAALIKRKQLPGISFTEESKRFYPRDQLAAHLLGFAGIDSQGLWGIEYYYDQILQGNAGRIVSEKDAAGREIPLGLEKYFPSEDGCDIVLTVDHVIQYIVERELDKALEEHEAVGGSIVVMDPQTGEVLAMASRPDFNPNQFAKFPQNTWRNIAISDSYEPGSTFKIVTTAAALEEGVVTPNDRFFDPGFIKVGGERIGCWKAGGHGSQTFAEVVQNSCNPGFVQVGMRLGKDRFYKYIKAFGFGEETGIDLPGEAGGIVYSYDEMGPVELATISYGHGIAVTPIQLATAASAAVNGGRLLKPMIVKKVLSADGEVLKEFQPEVRRQVISPETSKLTRELLYLVVEQGTGGGAKIPGYQIGGKTGTAKYYNQEMYDSSFLGFVPVDKPQLVILIVLNKVTSYPYYGGQIVAPIFKSVARDILRYLEIPPQSQDAIEFPARDDLVEVPDLKGVGLEEARRKIQSKGLNFALEGMGDEVVDQVPIPGAMVPAGSTVISFFEGARERKENYRVALPDLKGYGLEEAQRALGMLGLRCRISGNGIVYKQDPAPGTRVLTGEEIKLYLRKE
ncbi:MAG: stage V sporulation protein D [Halanaerobium sp.]|nr:stage V sporulation protein D [Halanaerobium sp.]